MENKTLRLKGRLIEVEYDFDPIVAHLIVDGQELVNDDEDNELELKELLEEIVYYSDTVTLDLATKNLLSDIEDYITSSMVDYDKQII
jgi:hypothetical protein